MGYRKFSDREAILSIIFQFPLWDTPQSTVALQVISKYFQFPLWDTGCLLIWFPRMPITFNSLYGIQSIDNKEEIILPDFYNFQFPLWDTLIIDVKEDYNDVTFNSLYGIPI